ncbi:uncharacterized protein LOC116603672 [Nematostella vectensis]|uniref:uncharacterized protein LOC116603672 n=1 Tax=Nematostella vectensis TaxID=45351 RepID=UPI00138FB811|nr:uncharacterized protein LOC116603672 [Nematostella vectensis]
MIEGRVVLSSKPEYVLDFDKFKRQGEDSESGNLKSKLLKAAMNAWNLKQDDTGSLLWALELFQLLTLQIQPNNLPRFPYEESQINVWFSYSRDCNQNLPNVMMINLDSHGKETNAHHLQNELQFPDGLLEEDHRLFYHGTNHMSAQSILRYGILLEKCRPRLDFSVSRGFYLNNNFDEAKKWGFSRGGGSGKCAVLVYRIKQNILNEQNHVDLRGQDKEEKWGRIVSGCRSGNRIISEGIARELSGKDFVQGPIAGLSKSAGQRSFYIKKGSYQLCLLTDDLASTFNGALHSVVFYTSD